MEQDRLGTNQTLDLVKSVLPDGARRILEVGAGSGALTRVLCAEGFQVHAIDHSPDAVGLAREKGTEMELADITAFQARQAYDAVVYSMSAHHVTPLALAMEKSAGALSAGGFLILEEYAVEDVDDKTARWFYDTLALLDALGAPLGENDLLSNLGEPLSVWQEDHSSHGEHHFNGGAEILREAEKQFSIVHVERGPYFYRYLTPRARQIDSPVDLGARLLALETTLIEHGRIEPIGLRVVGRRR